ncbi:MAG: hypothetical protein J7K09_07990, partial [Desulfuromusa sp.]|nr:hypothetical protein [Desulfuromusa sp.]
SQIFTDDETTVVRVAKAWDSPHAGTVPVLLGKSLKLAPFGSVPSFSRLNLQYRVIYKVEKEQLHILVEKVTPHDYRRK